MTWRVANRRIAQSQWCLGSMLAVCLAISPHYLVARNEGGMSNFGVHAATVVPFTLAFGGCAVLVSMSASSVPRGSAADSRFAAALRALGLLLGLVVVSTYPYQHGIALRDIHIAVAVVVTCFETVVSAWVAVDLARGRASATLLCVQVAGFVLAALTLTGVLHVLFVSQLLTTAPFGGLLVVCGRRLALNESA